MQSPWIANTDADVKLPSDYFDALTPLSTTKIAAVIFPFTALLSDKLAPLPTLLYDFSLHYYVDGLAWAGSPYSYQTIGSTIAVHFNHYAQVRGFPKRAAAEDFYILNKLAKTGEIKKLKHPHINIIARHSDRVPFGTGPAVSKLAQADNPLAMPLYHPDCFLYLKYFLQLQTSLCQAENFAQDNIQLHCQRLFNDQTNSPQVNTLLLAAEQFKLAAALSHCFKQGATPAARTQHLQHWFDGFKTLKFIHWLRDQQLGMLNFQYWLEHQQEYALPITAAMQSLIKQIQSSAAAKPVFSSTPTSNN
ncbi:hypothetical protein [Oceanicoccus sp. KOV_DT_Chl]|uniref:hypothetical protein n=1 Tax=Oceanicoccus sp. KOV_DT_Chl TaxID=1904639 RepID=UPI0011AF86CC|nr:hypothetical protein [Oceanicoccus sp. KOV_DT_Chl]